MTSIDERRHAWLKFAENNKDIVQFGQDHDSSTWGGATACTHVCIQMIAQGVHGKRPTIDQISRLMGYPTADQRRYRKGPSAAQAQAAMRALNLPYQSVFNLPTDDLVTLAKNRGPVIFGCWYGVQPQWQGFNYFGVKADGRPNGYAHPLGEAGKNQLTGDGFTHAEVLISARYLKHHDFAITFIRDPNHGSSSRPKKYPYDITTKHQLDRLYQSGKTGFIFNGRPYTFALVPTTEVNIP